MFLIAGCASIQTAPPAQDRKAKAFESSPNHATVYVYRDNSVNALVAMDVLVDGRVIGRLRNGHFLRVSVKPGQHLITSRASNEKTVSLKMQAGGLYFLKQMGVFKLFGQGTDLVEVGAAEGKKSVLGNALVENDPSADQ